VHATAESLGAGKFQLAVAVDANHTAEARAGVLIVGDQLYHVVQAAGEHGGGGPGPAAFGKVGPTSGSPATLLTPTLTWSASSGATGYWYCVERTPHAGMATCNTGWASAGATTSVRLTGLVPGVNYAWQVYAESASGVTMANSGTWWTLTTSALSQPAADLAIDFGVPGLWLYGAGGGAPVWRPLHHLSPSLLRTGDLDGNGLTDLVLDFPGYGLWGFVNNTTWQPLHPFDATAVETGDLDRNGRDDLVANFAGYGVWARYDDGRWRQLHWLNATRIAVGNIDGTVGGPADVLLAFPGQGLWAYRDNASWTMLHSLDVQDLQLADMDGNGLLDLIAQFAGFGEWVLYNSATWAPLHGLDAAGIVSGNLDGDNEGKSDLVINFPGYGVWAFLNNTTWTPLHGVNAPVQATADLDGNGQDDVILYFPGYGIWVLRNLTTWVPLHGLPPEAFASGRLHGT
jgi:hypothetical protein